MALVNDSIAVTPGSGAKVATNSPAGSNTTEYQVVVIADASGHMHETKPCYIGNVPPLVVAANRYHWELFNQSGSNVTVEVNGLYPVPDSSQAVTGVLSAAFDFWRTTAISSGGTIANFEASNSTMTANLARLDTGDPALLTSNVTLKTVLTSITTGAYLFRSYVFTEETAVASHLIQFQNFVPQALRQKGIVLRAGQGLVARQSPVASVGSVGWLIQFTTDP